MMMVHSTVRVVVGDTMPAVPSTDENAQVIDELVQHQDVQDTGCRGSDECYVLSVHVAIL